MPTETAADRAMFLDSNDFGDVATIGSNTFPGILDNEYIEVAGVASTHPVFLCDDTVATAAGAVMNASVSILSGRTGSSTTFKIRDKQPDGTGMTALILEKQ